MPLNKNAYTRYLLIDQRLNSKQLPAPSLSELTEFVSDKMDKSISESSIQKDILAMRKESTLGYYAPIIYDQSSRAYRYEYEYSINELPLDESDLQGISMALSILARYKDNPAIKSMEELLLNLSQKVNIQKENLESGEIISYENEKYLGIEFLGRIIDAIQHKQVLLIDYKRFQSDEVKEHRVHPYFIKEFSDRLYLIGLDIHKSKKPMVLTFSLDRCVDVITSREHFTEEIPDRDIYFRHLYGVSDSYKKPEKIELITNALQMKFLKSTPIHHSQKIEENADGSYTFHLDLVLNYELKSKILSLGPSVQVVKPESLRTEIKEMAEKIVQNYS